MTVAQWLIETMKKLGKAGVDSPRRDALVLLEDVLGKERSWVLAHVDYEIPEEKLGQVNKLTEKRLKREPLAYIRGKAWFYGRFFEVSPGALIPRPESEAFIELLKQLDDDGRWTMDDGVQIVDIGTGSGCLAITAKLEFPDIEVIATDTSKEALKIAKQNAKSHNVDIKFLNGSHFGPLPTSSVQRPSSIVLSNLPYVPNGLITSPEINKEPEQALFSGDDGLDHYRQLWAEIRELDSKPAYVLTESLESQHTTLAELAGHAGYTLVKTETLVQLFRRQTVDAGHL